jgi:two-component sensor histidine kinase
MDAKEFKGYTSFMSFFSDNLGNRWYCTPFGVIQVKLEKNRFTHYFTKAQTSNEKNNQTRGIYVNEKGLVYANVWDNICISNGIRTHSEIDYAMTYFNGEIYTGERYLTEYDEQKKAFSLPLFKAPNLVRGELCAIDSLTTDGLLLGFAKGIVTYNVVSKNVAAPINLNFPTPKFVYRFIKKEDHKIWAIAENGLFVLDNKADFIIDYWGPESKNKKKQLPFDRLHDAFVANDGIVWFATNGQGLFRWDKKGNDFKQFNITAGFPSDILYRIEEDAEHNLWISTDYGLVRFNTTDYKVSTYTTKEGISHNEFNRMSSFKAKDGRLFFGGLDGVNAFYPNQFSTDTSTTNAPLRIISYNQFSGKQDELLDQTAQLLEQKKIVLEPNDKFFILEFKLLDFEEGKSSYLFKIDGIDNEWNFLNQNSLRLSGIPFGNYTLRIRGQSQVGQKSSNEIVIPIEVLRPLIRKIGFQLFLLFVATLLVLFIIRFRTANLKRNSQLLAATVDKRTQQLRKTIGERDVLLKEIHHRVKNNLQVIVSLLSMHQKNIDSPELKQSFIEAKTNVRSISLIHENLYQHDSLAAVDMRSFADDLFKLINELFNSAKEKINFENNIVGAELDIETAVPLGLILNELFTNSFKYALNKEKELAITLTIKETSEQENYELVYSDNGKGLPANIDFLKTTTMGMSLIKDLCRQIGGKVHYENKNGCVFTIQFLSMKGRKQTD